MAERWSCKPKVMSSILIGGKHFFFKKNYQWKKFMTPTWFEHAAFWSGVRRATVAPRSQLNHKLTKLRRKQNEGSTEIWTRIAGFKVQSANHYTIEPWLVSQIFKVGKDHKCLSHSMYSVNFVFCVQISYFADIISGLSWGKYDIWTKKIILFPAGFEPATLCVWSTRDNHYTKETHILQGGNCNW